MLWKYKMIKEINKMYVSQNYVYSSKWKQVDEKKIKISEPQAGKK